MRRLLSFILFLAYSLVLLAQEHADSALASIDLQIAQEQQAGRVEKEGEARWKKIELLHRSSQADKIDRKSVV